MPKGVAKRRGVLIEEIGLKWPWFLVALLGVLLDFGTKFWAEQTLLYGVPEEVLPFLNWTLLYNKGAAFSFLADQAGWQRWFFTAVSLLATVILSYWIIVAKRTDRVHLLGLTLILSGAVGNLIDRLFLGYVVDFIHLSYESYSFPIFNVADIFVSLGVGIMLFSSLFEQEREG